MIKEKIIEYLKPFGYPNINPEIVLKQLPDIWKMLDNEKLIPEELTYQDFKRAAYTQYYIKLLDR